MEGRELISLKVGVLMFLSFFFSLTALICLLSPPKFPACVRNMLDDIDCTKLTPVVAVLLLNDDASSSNSDFWFPKVYL